MPVRQVLSFVSALGDTLPRDDTAYNLDRFPEPERMEDEAQAHAYADAGFHEPHAIFVRLWEEWRGAGALAGTIVTSYPQVRGRTTPTP